VKLSLFEGDVLSRVFAGLHVDRPDRRRTGRRIVAAVLATWIAVALLAMSGAVLLGPSTRESFLLDIAAFAQFLVVVPLLLAAEGYIDGRMGEIGQHFVSTGLVRAESRQRFDALLGRVAAIRGHWALEALCFVVAVAATWMWLGEEIANGIPTWHARLTPDGERLTAAGWWEGIVAVPMLNFIVFRWACKIGLWCYCLAGIARLRLELVPTHPDRAGGLAFVGDLQARFGVLIFAIGAMVMAITYQKTVIEAGRFLSFAALGPIIAYVLLAPAAFLLPLLFFTGQMARAKQAAVDRYASLLARLARQRAERLAAPLEALPEHPAGGESDYESVEEAYEAARHMRVIPFDLQTLARLLGSAVAPMLPLLTQVLPLPRPGSEILSHVAGMPSH
jgi:hypothetical protein